jgi:hypothetical protein
MRTIDSEMMTETVTIYFCVVAPSSEVRLRRVLHATSALYILLNRTIQYVPQRTPGEHQAERTGQGRTCECDKALIDVNRSKDLQTSYTIYQKIYAKQLEDSIFEYLLWKGKR